MAEELNYDAQAYDHINPFPPNSPWYATYKTCFLGCLNTIGHGNPYACKQYCDGVFAYQINEHKYFPKQQSEAVYFADANQCPSVCPICWKYCHLYQGHWGDHICPNGHSWS